MALQTSSGGLSMLLALAPAALLICMTTARGLVLMAADWAFRRPG